MQFSTKFAKDLPFLDSAEKVVTRPLLEMPLLISERALAKGSGVLAQYAESLSIAGHTPAMETIAMPKKGYGRRPIGILSPAGRTIYEALVGRLAPSLPVPSRDQGIGAHRAYGLQGGGTTDVRIVDMDIAACYEYIDHGLLADELLMQSLDPVGTQALTEFLGHLFPRPIGIPQALAASHLLADAYLNQVERGILRAGYDVNRFADDFRLIVPNWASADQAIELVVEEARAVGLTLADGKTRIHSVAQLLEQEEKREAMLNEYRGRAADDLRSMEFVQVGYDDFELEEVEAPDQEIDFVALKGIVEEWVTSDREKRTLHSSFGSRALRVLRSAPERLPDDWLLEIVAREPPHLRNVLVYLSGRPEHSKNWATVTRLAALPRTSPWARVWLLRISEAFLTEAPQDRVAFEAWATTCLIDNSEVVRSEAAWMLSQTRQVSSEQLARLFVESTSITQCGIAAVAGRLDGGSVSRLGKALRADSPLVKSAYEWGAANEN